ncbi:unnamed protein product [Cyprideis torosa]|uniref:Mitogen-activated protein kinase kinase kinase 1 n=1 Tax=Cyprideis torosa TaxID=163714 RepID=A0A7R8W5Y1_9CRUS|nr:unnamed protein product [Cyprideis torosa]CAG0883425.1 unnamed protein product [Cyprideis torosa]
MEKAPNVERRAVAPVCLVGGSAVLNRRGEGPTPSAGGCGRRKLSGTRSLFRKGLDLIEVKKFVGTYSPAVAESQAMKTKTESTDLLNSLGDSSKENSQPFLATSDAWPRLSMRKPKLKKHQSVLHLNLTGSSEDIMEDPLLPSTSFPVPVEGGGEARPCPQLLTTGGYVRVAETLLDDGRLHLMDFNADSLFFGPSTHLRPPSSPARTPSPRGAKESRAPTSPVPLAKGGTFFPFAGLRHSGRRSPSPRGGRGKSPTGPRSNTRWHVSPPVLRRSPSNGHWSPCGSRGPSPTGSRVPPIDRKVLERRIHNAQSARFYLVSRPGPTSFAVAGDLPDQQKFKVNIGPQSCSCGKPHCVHLLFILLRVFRLSEKDPLLACSELKNYQVNELLEAYDNMRAKRTVAKSTADGSGSGENAGHSESPEGEKMSRLTVPDASSGGSESASSAVEDDPELDLCPICLLEMLDGEALTECALGCHNKLHSHCISIWVNERNLQGESVVCPLCRAPWDETNLPRPSVATPVIQATPTPPGSSSLRRPSAIRSASASRRRHTPTASPSRLLPQPFKLNQASSSSPRRLQRRPRNSSGSSNGSGGSGSVPDLSRCSNPRSEAPLFSTNVARFLQARGLLADVTSKDWASREDALKRLANILRNPPGERSKSAHVVNSAAAELLPRMLMDPVSNVFNAAVACCQLLSPEKVRPVLNPLFLKCADHNRKTSHAALATLLAWVPEHLSTLLGEATVQAQTLKPSPPLCQNTWQRTLGGIVFLDALVASKVRALVDGRRWVDDQVRDRKIDGGKVSFFLQPTVLSQESLLTLTDFTVRILSTNHSSPTPSPTRPFAPIQLPRLRPRFCRLQRQLSSPASPTPETDLDTAPATVTECVSLHPSLVKAARKLFIDLSPHLTHLKDQVLALITFHCGHEETALRSRLLKQLSISDHRPRRITSSPVPICSPDAPKPSPPADLDLTLVNPPRPGGINQYVNTPTTEVASRASDSDVIPQIALLSPSPIATPSPSAVQQTFIEVKQPREERDPGAAYLEGIDWVRGNILGTGAFSNCYQAWDKATGTIMAAKQITFSRSSQEEMEETVSGIRQEVALLSRLSHLHPNVLPLLGVSLEGSSFFIFAEWMAGGSIASLLEKYGPFENAVIQRYSHQMLDGLSFLHDHGVLHRDLKGANMLVDSTGQHLRLGDFGAATTLLTPQGTIAGEFRGQLRGTIAFMAPEVLKGESYGRSSDIWSAGCCMIEMATAKYPWTELGRGIGDNHLALMFKIATSESPPPLPTNGLSPALLEIARECLQVPCKLRPTAKHLLAHPVFR